MPRLGLQKLRESNGFINRRGMWECYRFVVLSKMNRPERRRLALAFALGNQRRHANKRSRSR